MSFFGGGGVGAFGRPATTQPAQPVQPAEQDIEVSQPPTDGISSLSFSPVADFLAAACWDNNVSTVMKHKCIEVHLHSSIDSHLWY